MNERIVPDVVAKRPPTSEQHAREFYGLPADWECYKWEVHGDKGTGYITLTGGVYRHKLLRGPRKGQTNYRKPEPGTEQTIALPYAAQAAWRVQWERETGHCSYCEGTGQALSGWRAKTGNSYVTCLKCDGTGRAALTQAPAPGIGMRVA